jgi:hypothetical protein
MSIIYENLNKATAEAQRRGVAQRRALEPG